MQPNMVKEIPMQKTEIFQEYAFLAEFNDAKSVIIGQVAVKLWLHEKLRQCKQISIEPNSRQIALSSMLRMKIHTEFNKRCPQIVTAQICVLK